MKSLKAFSVALACLFAATMPAATWPSELAGQTIERMETIVEANTISGPGVMFRSARLSPERVQGFTNGDFPSDETSVHAASVLSVLSVSDASVLTAHSRSPRGDDCLVTCYHDCINENYHKAQQEGDTDEWDGGYHGWCAEGPCCRKDPTDPSCRHPSCMMSEEEDDDLAMLNQALVRSDFDMVVETLASNPSFILNSERGSIQLVNPCVDDPGVIIAYANLPLQDRQLGELRSLLGLEVGLR